MWHDLRTEVEDLFSPLSGCGLDDDEYYAAFQIRKLGATSTRTRSAAPPPKHRLAAERGCALCGGPLDLTPGLRKSRKLHCRPCLRKTRAAQARNRRKRK